MRTPGGHHRRSAFTLIELAMVLLILSILAAIVAPRYADAVARARVKAAGQRIVQECDYAATRARASGVGWRVAFDAANNTIFNRDVAYTMPFDLTNDMTDLDDEPFRTDIVQVNLSGASVVLDFDVYGRFTTGGIINLQSGAATATVQINANTGRIEVQ